MKKLTVEKPGWFQDGHDWDTLTSEALAELTFKQNPLTREELTGLVTELPERWRDLWNTMNRQAVTCAVTHSDGGLYHVEYPRRDTDNWFVTDLPPLEWYITFGRSVSDGTGLIVKDNLATFLRPTDDIRLWPTVRLDGFHSRPNIAGQVAWIRRAVRWPLHSPPSRDTIAGWITRSGDKKTDRKFVERLAKYLERIDGLWPQYALLFADVEQEQTGE